MYLEMVKMHVYSYIFKCVLGHEGQREQPPPRFASNLMSCSGLSMHPQYRRSWTIVAASHARRRLRDGLEGGGKAQGVRGRGLRSPARFTVRREKQNAVTGVYCGSRVCLLAFFAGTAAMVGVVVLARFPLNRFFCRSLNRYGGQIPDVYSVVRCSERLRWRRSVRGLQYVSPSFHKAEHGSCAVHTSR